MSLKPIGSPLVVALDVASRREAVILAEQLNPKICRVKVGKELFTAAGPQVLEDIHRLGFEIFLDLKFHDIPVTVAKAVKVAADLGVWMVNVHTSGGTKMLAAAGEALINRQQRPLLIGVTLLTSFGQLDFAEIGGVGEVQEQVKKLSLLAFNAGLDGVVCSALEVGQLKAVTAKHFLAVTPGIRPAGSESQDQTRIMTPAAALAEGSDYLVIGRPITQAADPGEACAAIAKDVRFLPPQAEHLS